MLKKRSELKKQAKEIRSKWNHIPSLKGKDVERNLFILRQLAIKPMSCWDLALEYLKTDQTFNYWSKDKIYHERQKENATMNRRLKFLLEKNYVKKLNSLYDQTLKGFFLLFAVDPGFIHDVPSSRLNRTISDLKTREITDIDFGTEERDLSQKEIKLLKAHVPKDKIARKTWSFVLRKLLFAWKINMDEIGERELMRIFMSRLEKWASKRGYKITGIDLDR